MVVVISYPYYGDSFAIYTYIELLCCTPETKIMYANKHQLKKKELLDILNWIVLNFSERLK